MNISKVDDILSCLTIEQKSNLADYLRNTASRKHRLSPVADTTKGRKIEQREAKRAEAGKKGWRSITVQHQKRQSPVEKFDVVSATPNLYYCGACRRRLTTFDELRGHSGSWHEHHAFYGAWPLHKFTKIIMRDQLSSGERAAIAIMFNLDSAEM